MTPPPLARFRIPAGAPRSPGSLSVDASASVDDGSPSVSSVLARRHGSRPLDTEVSVPSEVAA